jgi:cysteine-rich repeat protein
MSRLLALSLLLLPLAAHAAKLPPCPAARYLIDAADVGLIFGDQTPTTDAFTYGTSSLAIPTCGQTAAKAKANKKGVTTFKAMWKVCGSLKKVLAQGTITNGCATMQGTIKAKKVGKKPFSARISTGCGDGVLDKGLGEQCENGAGCAADQTCDAQCHCTSTATTTTVTPTTTTTSTTLGGCHPSTTAQNACGNCTVDPGETCDDGNTVDGDSCPHNCVIESCTLDQSSTRTFSVDFTPPAGVQLAGITVLLDYPEGQVAIPGGGNDAQVLASISHLPFGRASSPNDLDYALIEAVVGSSALTPGRLFTVTFDDCQGATVPTAADFTCTVTDAADTGANVVDPTTVGCTVTSP